MNYRICFAGYLRRKGRQERTIRSYNAALGEFMNYCANQRRRNGLLKHMVPSRLEGYKAYLLNHKGLRPSTINRRLAGLSAFARMLVTKGLLPGNPLDLVARVNGREIKTENLRASWEGVQKVRMAVNEDVMNVRDRAVVELLYAGLTVRELCDLKWDGVWSADKNAISTGERQISLQARACLALEHYMILRPILRGEYLLPGSGPGWSLKPGRVYSIVRCLSRVSGVRVGVRDLRLARYAAEVWGFGPAYATAPAAA